jgi:hypothetical protein
MSWTSVLILLLAWLAIGLGIAYLFGRFVRGADAPESAGCPPSVVVWYRRRINGVKTSLRMPAFPDTRTRH